MAQLVLGLAGAAVGAPFGLGALGFSLGAAAGAALFPPDLGDQQGPRLEDLRVTSPTLGSPVPVVYGTIRVACQMIWTDGITETTHTQEIGGKGGPSGTVTSYTYSLSASYAICEGPITGVRRMWINQQLVYDRSATASGEQVVALEDISDSLTIYTGTETQDPSALQESIEGVGNVSPYKGLAYFDIENLQLAEFGNRAGNVEVEVVIGGTESSGPCGDTVLTTFPTYIGDVNQTLKYDNGVLIVSELDVDDSVDYEITHTITRYDLTGTLIDERVHVLSMPDGLFFQAGQVNNDPEVVFAKNNKSPIPEFRAWSDGQLISTTLPVNPYLFVSPATQSGAWGTAAAGNTRNITQWGGHYYVTGGTGTATNHTNLIKMTTGLTYVSTADIQNTHEGSPSANRILAVDNVGEYLWMYTPSSTPGTHKLTKLDSSLGFVDYWSDAKCPGIGTAFTVVYNKDDPSDSHLLFGDEEYIDCYSFDADTTNSDFTLISHTSHSSSVAGVRPLTANTAVTAHEILSIGPLIAPGNVSLASIITDICGRVSLGAGDIDVTDHTTTYVDGYALGHTMTARAALEPLTSAYYFDTTEVDNKLDFVARGGASVKTIASADMAAHEYGQQTPDVEVVERTNDIELPKRLTVQYIDKDANYERAEQHSDKLSTTGDALVSVQAPVAMSADYAAQISEIALYSVHAERERITFAGSTKLIGLVPTDPITVGDNGYRVRVTEVDNQLDGLAKISGVLEYADVYTSSRTGSDIAYAGVTLTAKGPTRAVLMDIPLMRTEDNASGFYSAISGYLDSWSSGLLYRSTDGGATFNQILIDTTTTVIGNATNTLADADWHTWDSVSTVNVSLSSGTLSSSTDAAVLNGANVAVLGKHGTWEVIQFVTATLEADGSYTLSRLLRGRRGTEQLTDNHVTGDVFVLLTEATIRRVSTQSADTTANIYKAVTTGAPFQDASEFTFKNTNQCLKPFAPLIRGASRNGSNDLTIDFTYRSRLFYSGNYRIDSGESSLTNGFECDITVGGSVVRTITSTASANGSVITWSTTSIFYDNLDQTADGITPGDPVDVTIYYLSSAYGRGWGEQDTSI